MPYLNQTSVAMPEKIALSSIVGVEENSSRSKEISRLMLTALIDNTPLRFEIDIEKSEAADIKYFVERLWRDLIKHYRKDKQDISWLRVRYQAYKDTYTVSDRWNVYFGFVFELQTKAFASKDIQLQIESWEEWQILQAEEWENWNIDWSYRDSLEILDFERRIGKPLVKGKHIYRFPFKRNLLTEFGKRNVDQILNKVDDIINQDYPLSFFEPFIFNFNSIKVEFYPIEYYSRFFLQDGQSQKLWNRLVSEEKSKAPKKIDLKQPASRKLVSIAIGEEAGNLLRKGENEYRTSIGAKKVGEAWISETELFHSIKSIFPELRIVQHGKPSFLDRQHYDIWLPDLLLAIEYHGKQHFEPVEFFGGKKAFEQNVKRDKKKIELSKTNGVELLIVKRGYDIVEVENFISKRLHS